MSEKEKLIEIIKQNSTYNGRSMCVDYYVVDVNWLAELILKNGFGEISEWKARTEKAELNNKIKDRALENESRYCEIMMGFAKDEQDLEQLVQHRIENAKKQAKKEIEEERKND